MKIAGIIKQIRNDLLPIKNGLTAAVMNKSNLGKFIDRNNLENTKNKDRIFLLETSVNGNMGDQAISIAQLNYLYKKYGKNRVFEIPSCNLYRNFKLLKRIIRKNDLIFIQGGGNLGNLYMDAEHSRRFIIKKFPYNRIISFPQSSFFSKNFSGNIELKRSKEIYSKHKHLYIGARDKSSEKFLKENFTNNMIFLSPDIVLSNSIIENDRTKSIDITTMLRSDTEKSLSDNFYDTLEKTLSEMNLVSNKSDTWSEQGLEVFLEKRKQEYSVMISQFLNTKLIITDRLHGMILSYITGTPCIALNNSYKKVENTYTDWLKDSNYIELISEDVTDEELSGIIQRMLMVTPAFKSLRGEFSELDKILEDINNE